MKPKTKIAVRITLLLSVIAYIVMLYIVRRSEGAIMLGVVMMTCPMMLTYAFCFMFLEENRIAYSRVLVKERQKYYGKMMASMNNSYSYDLTFKELYSIINKKRHLRLYRYTPFRAWYKNWIDTAGRLAYVSIRECYPFRSLGNDKFYDPSAPPMSKYFKDDDEMVRSWDDELDDYGDPKPLTREDLEDAIEDALKDYGRKHKRNSAADGLAIGIGIGIGNSLTGGHGLGSGS